MRAKDFDGLFTEHAGRLFSFLVYRTDDRALAEDVVADTFERALRSRRRFDPGKASQKTWLYAIALNRLRDHKRRIDAEDRRSHERHRPQIRAAAGAMTVESRGSSRRPSKSSAVRSDRRSLFAMAPSSRFPRSQR